MPHICSAKQAGVGVADCDLLIIAYIFAGLAMMLNIRLSYSSAPYALIRFKLPENLFSVFVRRMASALELWCLPSMLLGNIIDLIQKLAVNTDGDLKIAAGASASPGTLRKLAEALHDRANELNAAVKKDDDNAAKVLHHKAGKNDQTDGKLRKLAADLYSAVSQLESSVPAHSDEALKQKAGTTQNDGLRKLAKTLQDAASKLVIALKDVNGPAVGAATQIEFVIGYSENNEGLQKALKDLSEQGTGLAKGVRDNYNEVEKKFKAVKGQNDTHRAYNEGAKKTAYDSVVNAWEAFEALYKTDLKQLAKELKDAVCSGSQIKLQQALQELGNLPDASPELTNKAQDVKNAYQNPSGVKTKFNAVKEKGPSYQAIAAIQPLYDNVKASMGAFDTVYRPEELLMDAVGDSEGSGLRQKLAALGDDNGSDPGKLSELVTAVKEEYSENWGPTVKSIFELVMAQAPAYEKGNTIKSEQYKNLLEAWTNFNDKYYGVISSPKYYSIVVPSVITQWLNFLTYVILFVVYVAGGESGHLTIFYLVIAISGFVFGINMTLVYSVDWNYIPIYIAGENCFPIITSFIHYITTLMFGNRRKYNSDFIVVVVDIIVAIIISFMAAVIWTVAYLTKPKYASATDKAASWYHHIFSHGFSGDPKAEVISPFLMIVVGMGLVYAIYPGIAPGMIVPFYLIDKIEMVLLIATIFPPVIVAALRRTTKGWPPPPQSPMCQWTLDIKGFDGQSKGTGLFWHAFDLLMVIKISLAVIFIYSLHYRESHISRSIINQPKMSTFLSITFYMCHECLLALGFPGLVGANNGGDYVLIPQYIGALFMIFLAFYSEGYIIEYKSHDPQHWPT